ncbi:inositol phosphorylceramide synthase [Rhodococcus sp. D2-41]|uniref:Phosphatase PAP2 family protein n=1 Tax=Speluncibacter jeojiensis TaxID=2710754 RepID=A0A9X4M7Q0_9ACTN|nr:phosphatase PAP2 family protein [Rhodococcus sp. D2-41]MDG3010298.1 inositol phosphorylceramide synthase [Rhodococcus sp. D2-41]MDG3015811.1 phosphatase PAP2 family protein [Corynebacteriales bacterium D3-21]
MKRPPLWGEVLVVVALAWGYDLIEGLAPARRATALAHGQDLLVLEQWLRVDVEADLNSALLRAGSVVELAADYYYAMLHFAVTFAVLGWLYLRRPAGYRRWRNILVVVNAVALVVFWLYPVAPPRLLSGFVDTVVADHTLGSWGSPAASSANVYAAMPSLHVAWALWCAAAIAATARHGWVRSVVWIYPLLTGVVVIATANHYLLDTLAAVVVVAVSWALVAAGHRVLARPPDAVPVERRPPTRVQR